VGQASGPLTLIYFDQLQVLTVNFKNRKIRQVFFDKEQKGSFSTKPGFGSYECIYIYDIPVVPHKAVAEVSKIGNL